MTNRARWSFLVCSLVLVLCISSARAAGAPSPDGRWEGDISLPGMKMHILVALRTPSGGKDAALTGDISIPQQNAKNVPLEKCSAAGDQLTFAIAGIPGDPTFVGKLSDDGSTLTGYFTQGGQQFPFELKKAKAGDDGKAKLEGFDAWLDKARDDWHVPGIAVAIVRHGEVIYAKGSGFRDLDTKTPVTTKTLFAIGSSSKAFTTFVLGALADEQKINFDKPVRQYLPGFELHDPTASDHMTVRDLVTHRSGLPRHDALWYNSTLSRAELVSRLKYLEPNEDFRAKWQYNNLMFLTAGVVIEQVTGKHWEDAVRERVMAPLGMTHSNFSVVDSQKADDFAQPYEWRTEDDGSHEMRKMPFRDITNMGPAGSINSCVDDMTRWLMVHLGDGKIDGKRIISSAVLADLHHPQMVMGGEVSKDGVVTVGYAMGWFVDVYRGHLRVHHGGNIDGFSALVTLLPDDDMGLVILCNQNASALPGLTNRHAIDRVLGLEARDWSAEALAKAKVAEESDKGAKARAKELARKPDTKPAHPIAEYAGEYEHPGYGIIKITENGGTLSLEYNRLSAPLSHWHFETFVCGKNPADPVFEDQQIEFHTSMDGDVDGLEIAIEPAIKAQLFTRRGDASLRDAALLAKFAGEYELGSQVAKVTLAGTTLTLNVPGQPPYELEPLKENTFALKGVTGFRVKFNLEKDAAAASGFVSLQPNGAFTAKRKK